MKTYVRAGLLTAAAMALPGRAAIAQTTQPDDRLQRLERRLDEMDRQHQQELKARDAEIARLKARLDSAPTAPSGAGGTVPAPATGSASGREKTLLDEIDAAGKPAAPAPANSAQTGRDVLRDADSRSSPLSLSRSPISFNPDLAVVSDGVASYSTHRANNALNRFDVREAELDLRAAVDPRADGVAILSLERDVDNPVFPALTPTPIRMARRPGSTSKRPTSSFTTLASPISPPSSGGSTSGSAGRTSSMPTICRRPILPWSIRRFSPPRR